MLTDSRALSTAREVGGRGNGKQGVEESSPETDFLSAEGSGPTDGKTDLYEGLARIHSEQESQREASIS